MADSLSDALATLRGRYGPQALRRAVQPEPAQPLPTGVPVLDSQLLPGGLPRGRITVLAAGAAEGASGRLTLLQTLTAIASRSSDAGYVDLTGTLDPGFLADLGADLTACLVMTPGVERWERGLRMGRALVAAGLPWLSVALGGQRRPSSAAWELALAALAEAAAKRSAVAVIAAPAPLARALAHASSHTLTCTGAGWQRAHRDVSGLRVRVLVSKSKVGAPGAEAMLLLRYPRPYTSAGLVGLPTLLPAELAEPVAPAAPAAARLMEPLPMAAAQR